MIVPSSLFAVHSNKEQGTGNWELGTENQERGRRKEWLYRIAAIIPRICPFQSTNLFQDGTVRVMDGPLARPEALERHGQRL
jgi:hypothetical protein